MIYATFILKFTLIHMITYVLAGAVAFAISKDIYESKARYADFLRDTGNPDDKAHIGKFFLLAQIPRGIMMALVLLPVLEHLTQLGFGIKALFFGGLMLIFTEISAAIPFPTNIEGLVYMHPRYLLGRKILKFWLEILLYSCLFGLAMAWLV